MVFKTKNVPISDNNIDMKNILMGRLNENKLILNRVPSNGINKIESMVAIHIDSKIINLDLNEITLSSM